MSQTINIQITVDAKGIIHSYTTPSKDPNNPTTITPSYTYMVATSNSISGSGTGELDFSANVGDIIRFFGVSASNNSENAILIYGINKYSGPDVFSDFSNKTFTKLGISPSTPSTLPADVSDQLFWFYEADIAYKGTEDYTIIFALYRRNLFGHLKIYGYFKWSTKITVKG